MNSKKNNLYSAKAFKTCTNSAVSYSAPRQKVISRNPSQNLLNDTSINGVFWRHFWTIFWNDDETFCAPNCNTIFFVTCQNLGDPAMSLQAFFSSVLHSLVLTFSCTVIFVTANSNPLPFCTLLHRPSPGVHTVLQGSLTNQQWGLEITLTEKDREN